MQIEEHFDSSATQDTPLLQYVSFTAPHWPIHALPEDKAKYAGAYDEGYEAIREARFQRMKDEGIIPQSTVLPPEPQSWENLSANRRAWEADQMEAYAGMVDNMDQNIGKIRQALDAEGELDNTLFVFLSDNGGSAENYGRGGNLNNPSPRTDTGVPLGDDFIQTSIFPNKTRDGYVVRGIGGTPGAGVEVGPPDTYISYGRNWANVSNTPLQDFKTDTAEGGLASPFIVSWGAGIDPSLQGSINHTPTTVHDIMATVLDLTGVEYPGEAEGLDPLEGVTLAPSFTGEEIERGKPLFFEHTGWRAVRDGKWKALAPNNGQPWELYDLQADRSETNNLAAAHPEIVAELSLAWQGWAVQNNVVPWPFDPQFVGEMVVHLTMDDERVMNGLGLRDKSGNVLHGILTSDNGLDSLATPAGGPPGLGGAVAFDRGDIIDLEYPDQLPAGDDPRTIAAWVQSGEFAGRQDIFGYGNPNSNGREFTLSIEESGGEAALVLQAGGAASVRFAADPADGLVEGEWMHVAAVVPIGASNLSDVIVYLNGEALTGQVIGPNASLNTTESNFGVGGLAAGDDIGGVAPETGFNGLIGDFQLYQLGLSATQIDFLIDNAGFNLTEQVFIVPPVDGDYNGDGLVNAADYTVWRDQLGRTDPAITADGDNDGVVDIDDYLLWRDNFGAGQSGDPANTGPAAAPEPSAAATLLVCLLAAAVGRRSRR